MSNRIRKRLQKIKRRIERRLEGPRGDLGRPMFSAQPIRVERDFQGTSRVRPYDKL